jgi:cell wall assembly regulator SMI1
MINPDRVLAMEAAIRDHNLPKVRLLLKAGVPADHVYNPTLGWSFANLAAEEGDEPIFRCLIDAGADINHRSGSLGSMLHHAACSRRASSQIVARVLAEATIEQADLNSTLLYVPEHGNLEIVERLLHAGADPRYANDEGATALLHAVIFRQSDIAIRLIQAGADPGVRVPYEEHYKLVLTEVAAINGMQDFLSVCGGRPIPAETAPPLRTLNDALLTIDGWLSANAPGVRLGPPNPAASLPEPLCDSAYSSDILSLFRLHDGSSGESTVPMRNDISYEFVPLEEALRERTMMLGLVADESGLPDVPAGFWKPAWLPFASNGAGDYLVWDGVSGSVLQFSHETRVAAPRAGSLLELFQDIANGLQTGKYNYSEARGIA